MRASFSWCAVVLSVAACGGGVSVDAASGTSGAGGSGGAGAGGGSVVDAGADADAAKVCGGKAGLPCAADEWCHFSDGAWCGGSDEFGVCTPRPEGCPADCPGVCGCDGGFYCNECSANASGVDVGPNDESCVPPDEPGIYSAANMATNVSRFMIFKTLPAKDICVRMMVEGISGGQLDVQCPDGWSVGSAEITNHASDCVIGPGGWPEPAIGESVNAEKGTGTLTIQFPQPGNLPCNVALDATLVFPPGPSWAPPSEVMKVASIQVENGCW